MPPARLGGLRFYISSDDLLVPYAINALLYTVVTIVFGTYYHFTAAQYHSRARKRCSEDVLHKMGLLLGDGYILVFIFTLQILTSLGATVSAGRGTILQMSKRKLAMPFAVLSTLISVLAFPFLGFFIYSVYSIGDGESCAGHGSEVVADEDTGAVRALGVLCWVMLTVCICGPLLNFAILNLYPSFRATAHGFCKGLVTCCGCTEVLEDVEGGDSSVQEDVVDIMHRIFAPMSMVASDLFAGMILLASYQGSNRQALLKDHKAQESFGTLEEIAEKASRLLTPPSLPLSEDQVRHLSNARPYSPELGQPVRKEALLVAEYFLHFAQAAYGEDTTETYGELARSTVTNALSAASGVPIGRSVNHESTSKRNIQTHLAAWERWFKEPFRGPFRKPQKGQGSKSKRPGHRSEGKKLQKWRDVLTNQLGLCDDEILDLQLENKAVGTVPYYIALDRIRNCIVVSIRGSYSLQDAFTDMITTAAPITALLNRGGLFGTPTAVPECDIESTYVPPSPTFGKDEEAGEHYQPAGPMAEAAEGDIDPHDLEDGLEDCSDGASFALNGAASRWKAVIASSEEATNQGAQRWDEIMYPGGYGHRGIVLSAVRLLDAIRARGVLAEAVTKHKDMNVVITGHSLGAGLAALLAMALEPELKERLACWAFCPPGGLLNVQRALSTASYVTTVIHAHDMVARLTWRSIDRLRDEMMTAVALSTVNKNELWWRSICYARDASALSPDKLLSESGPNDPEVRAAVKKYNSKVKRALMELGTGANLRFWAPGQIIYLRPLKADRDYANHGGHSARRDPPRIYDALWISYETLEAEGLLVSPLAADDHILASAHNAICQALVRVSNAQASASSSAAHLAVADEATDLASQG